MEMIDLAYYVLIIINLIYSLYLMYWLWKARKQKTRSLTYSFFLLALTMILIIFIPILEVVEELPGWPWHIIKMFSLFLFLVSLNLVLNKINESIYAYEELTKIIQKGKE
ncbi:hypothetical protein J7J90_04050 [Candidatus Micrarchaeota archaeon]|nr:hypothetical protein [Candidatus Micrarchaeota archaeon]